MIFEIRNIIESDELKIKLLSYADSPAEVLDLSILSAQERGRFTEFISNKRKLEFYFTRLLWLQFSRDTKITYAETGKPKIENGFLSITHSRNIIVIAFSVNHEIGLDIEHYSDKVLRIRDKFLSHAEQKRFDTNDIKTMTTLWSIKEAVYKSLNIPGLIFKDHIRVMEIGEINRVIVSIRKQKKELLFFRLNFENFILIYCAKETPL